MKPTLAETYSGQDPAGMLVSEKLDGIRCLWDGAQLKSRTGKELRAPAWFTSALPNGVALDGELWLGRGRFQEVLSIVGKRTPVDSDWHALKYVCFDGPNSQGDFTQRLANITRILQGNAVATALPHSVCRGSVHLQEMLAAVIQAGGEGVMLRNPAMPYTEGRTGDLLKLKPKQDDEGTVTALEHDAKGALQTICCAWHGLVVKLSAGITALTRERPPTIGASVTFTYSGVSDSGLPKCTSFVCVRSYE